jgi:hypothetical protein
VKLPVSLNDEYEQKVGAASKSKYLHKYTLIEQELSVNNVSSIWQDLYENFVNILDNKFDAEDPVVICVNLPEAMPLSCNLTHLHKFETDNSSEPKIIFQNQTWFK